MARVHVSSVGVLRAAVTSPDYRVYVERVANEIENEAQRVFRARENKTNQGRTSETTPPKYLESFTTEWRGQTLFLINEDPAANWVEFGAHAGGKTPVLKYRPLGTALEIVANREAG